MHGAIAVVRWPNYAILPIWRNKFDCRCESASSALSLTLAASAIQSLTTCQTSIALSPLRSPGLASLAYR